MGKEGKTAKLPVLSVACLPGSMGMLLNPGPRVKFPVRGGRMLICRDVVNLGEEGEQGTMSANLAPTIPSNLGFLTVAREPAGYLGGYLVTNTWGKPLEFRLTSAVQPQRVHQILYGDSLECYLCGDLIGKTLLDKTTTPVQMVVTDTPGVLVMRLKLEIPIALIAAPQIDVSTYQAVQDRLFCHSQYPRDVSSIRAILEKLGPLDLSEPFARIREALGEARKLGVAKTAA